MVQQISIHCEWNYWRLQGWKKKMFQFVNIQNNPTCERKKGRWRNVLSLYGSINCHLIKVEIDEKMNAGTHWEKLGVRPLIKALTAW